MKAKLFINKKLIDRAFAIIMILSFIFFAVLSIALYNDIQDFWLKENKLSETLIADKERIRITGILDKCVATSLYFNEKVLDFVNVRPQFRNEYYNTFSKQFLINSNLVRSFGFTLFDIDNFSTKHRSLFLCKDSTMTLRNVTNEKYFLDSLYNIINTSKKTEIIWNKDLVSFICPVLDTLKNIIGMSFVNIQYDTIYKQISDNYDKSINLLMILDYNDKYIYNNRNINALNNYINKNNIIGMNELLLTINMDNNVITPNSNYFKLIVDNNKNDKFIYHLSNNVVIIAIILLSGIIFIILWTLFVKNKTYKKIIDANIEPLEITDNNNILRNK